ncbi:Tvingi protein, partial [Trypanosoma conorhini]
KWTREEATRLLKKAHKAPFTYQDGFRCHICNAEFDSRFLLVGHLQSHQPQLPVEAAKDAKRRRDEVDPKQHQLRCPGCPKKFILKGFLHRHMTRCHPNRTFTDATVVREQVPPAPPTVSQNPLHCPKCNRTFGCKAWVTRHKCTPSRASPAEEGESEAGVVASSTEQSPCPICGNEYPRIRMHRHLQMTHPDYTAGANTDPVSSIKREPEEDTAGSPEPTALPAASRNPLFCTTCKRTLKSKSGFATHKCKIVAVTYTPSQPGTFGKTHCECPLCGQRVVSHWFSRHLREKHPGHQSDVIAIPLQRAKRARDSDDDDEGKTALVQKRMDASRGLDSTHEAGYTDDAWLRGHHKQGNSSLVCARCGVTYMRLGSLVRHTRRHHKDSKVAQIRLEDGSLLFHDMGDREFQCPHCPLKST